MKKTLTFQPLVEVEVDLPCYMKDKSGYMYFYINEQGECVHIFNGENMEEIGYTCQSVALAPENLPSNRKEFETQFESVLTIIKNKVGYAR